MSDQRLIVKRLSPFGFLPTRGSSRAIGVDLYSAHLEVVVPAKGKALIYTDIAVKLPRGTYGRIAPRSGLALHKFIDVGAGVIDEDFIGNIGVLLFNFGDEDFTVRHGDRIAQLICEKALIPDIVEVRNPYEDDEDDDDDDDNIRGVSGFGSTGR